MGGKQAVDKEEATQEKEKTPEMMMRNTGNQQVQEEIQAQEEEQAQEGEREREKEQR